MAEIPDSACAEAVVEWVNREYTEAVEHYIKMRAESVGNYEAGRTWDDTHPNDGVGGMGSNPYTIANKRLSEDADNAATSLREWKAVRDFVIRRVCNLIEDAPAAS